MLNYLNRKKSSWGSSGADRFTADSAEKEIVPLLSNEEIKKSVINDKALSVMLRKNHSEIIFSVSSGADRFTA